MENGDRADKEEETLEPRDDMAALSYVRGDGWDGWRISKTPITSAEKRGGIGREGDLDLRL